MAQRGAFARRSGDLLEAEVVEFDDGSIGGVGEAGAEFVEFAHGGAGGFNAGDGPDFFHRGESPAGVLLVDLVLAA